MKRKRNIDFIQSLKYRLSTNCHYYIVINQILIEVNLLPVYMPVHGQFMIGVSYKL
jgi:hypothetical protein